MQSSYDVHPLIMRMRYPISQGHFKLMNRDCYADRCNEKISFFPFQPEIRAIAALLRREKQFRIITQLNYVTVVTVYFSVCCYRRLP